MTGQFVWKHKGKIALLTIGALFIGCFVFPAVGAAVAGAVVGMVTFGVNAAVMVGSFIMAAKEPLMAAVSIASFVFKLMSPGGSGGSDDGPFKINSRILASCKSIMRSLGLGSDLRLLILMLLAIFWGSLMLLRYIADVVQVSFITLFFIAFSAGVACMFVVNLYNATQKYVLKSSIVLTFSHRSFIIQNKERKDKLIKQAAVCAVAAYESPMSPHQKRLLNAQGITILGAHANVLIAQDDSTTFVSFRGTDDIADLLSDVKFGPTSHLDEILHRGTVAISSPFLILFQGFYKRSKLVPSSGSSLISLFKQDESRDLVFTGHSLGCAASQVAFHRFVADNGDDAELQLAVEQGRVRASLLLYHSISSC